MVLDYAHVLASTASPAAVETPMQSARRHRLLRDVAEMQQRPYPRIRLTPVDLTQACLVLTPEAYSPLHLTVLFGPEYPLQPPRITMQSRIRHPNVFGSYICASILNTTEGYTPAYTLKGICIQMLSFFNSDSVEQDHGGRRVSLLEYRKHGRVRSHECAGDDCRACRAVRTGVTHTCSHCGFGRADPNARPSSGSDNRGDGAQKAEVDNGSTAHTSPEASENGPSKKRFDLKKACIDSLPDEILLETLESVDFEDLVAFAQAWPRVRQLLEGYDLIRSRELQCFTTKYGYKQANLGVGIAFTPAGHVPRVDSEFDLVSHDAYEKLRVRRSVHGIPYQYWLPLPLARGHWLRVRDQAGVTLCLIAQRVVVVAAAAAANKPGRGPSGPGGAATAVAALFSFMNDIVVRLNLDLEDRQGSSGRGRGGRRRRRRRSLFDDDDDDSGGGWRHEDGGNRHEEKSTLRHASEKAIESYFHLFHLLVCLATGPGGVAVVAEANTMIRSFLRGRRGKRDVPNLGHLLTAMHISDVPVTDELRKAIITEAITRNVVWLLDGRGAGMAELAYLEDDAVSHYRLKKTFQGSRTSYRLLMFSELFRRVARPRAGAAASSAAAAAASSGPSLVQVRDALFARHGAPPDGAAAHLAAEVRRLRHIDAFPPFLAEMGLRAVPSARSFTAALRATVRGSVEARYSRDVPAHRVLSLRMHRDPEMDRRAALEKVWSGGSGWEYSARLAKEAADDVRSGRLTFFPERRRS
ncbi:hypothetical protein V2A60_005285 [Cordyceps javanica]